MFQEVFLRYFKIPRSFESEEHRKAWLIRVTINCTRKLCSSAWFRRTEPLEDTAIIDAPPDLELGAALAQLSAKYRTVIHLFYYEDFSVRRISEIMNLSESHVRTLLTRARSKLRELLKGEDLDV